MTNHNREFVIKMILKIREHLSRITLQFREHCFQRVKLLLQKIRMNKNNKKQLNLGCSLLTECQL